VILSRPAGATGLELPGLTPDRIESIEVVKGAAAAALYGSRAAGGVIMIRTKK
jgi:TonB-dependent SusC/RagA subfamily outer membrane receptor